VKITLKEINKVQYVACMNPTAGSFVIDPRLQRHFAVFAIGFPGGDALQTIYHTILKQHLASQIHHFPSNVQRIVPSIIYSALTLHQKVASNFLPVRPTSSSTNQQCTLNNFFSAFSDRNQIPLHF